MPEPDLYRRLIGMSVRLTERLACVVITQDVCRAHR